MLKKLKIISALVFPLALFCSLSFASAQEEVFPTAFYNVNAQLVNSQSNTNITYTGLKILFQNESGLLQGACFTSSGVCSVSLPAGEYQVLSRDGSVICSEPACPLKFQVVDKNVNLQLKVGAVDFQDPNIPQKNSCSDSDASESNPFFVKGAVRFFSGGSRWFTGMVDSCITKAKVAYVREYSCSEGVYNVDDYQCPNGCYEGACVKSCQNDFDKSYQCLKPEQLEQFRSQCPSQKIENEPLRVGQYCSQTGGTSCATCGDLALPNLTVLGASFACPQSSYKIGEAISKCSVKIQNVGNSVTVIAPKTNLYDVTHDQQWRRLSQIASPGVLEQNGSAAIVFDNFSFAAAGAYNIRACVDDDPKEITESNEDNNCSEVLSVEARALSSTCSDCGQGILNGCDEKECRYGLGPDCVFFNGFLGLNNKCFNQTDCQAFCKKQATNYICGNNGTTYANECLAKCDQRTVAYQGQCEQAVDCVALYGAGWWCGAAKDQISQCGRGIGSLQLLSGNQTCDKTTAVQSCVTCAITECDTNAVSICPNFPCSTNQAPQCLKGQCLCKNVVIPPVATTTPAGAVCVDSDGKNYLLAGATTGLGIDDSKMGVFNDYCDPKDSNVLYEYYCWDSTAAKEQVKCGYGCENGARKKSSMTKCSSSNDCANFPCQINQVPQCLDAMCVCKDIPQLIDCQKEYGANWWCGTAKDQIGQCGQGIGSLRLLSGNQTCDKTTAVQSCVTCAITKCSTIKDCANLVCIATQTFQCSDGKCVCKDIVAPPITKCSASPGGNSCANFPCGPSQTSQCVDAMCVCKDNVVPPKISVLSPNGGETFEIGKTYKLDWQASGVSSNSKIKVYVCTDQSMPICLSINGGALLPATQTSLSWTIPVNLFGLFKAGISTNDRFRIRVSEVLADGSIGVFDMSDNNFSIVAAVIPSSLCSDCGQQGFLRGLFDACNQAECKKIGSDCIFFDKFFGLNNKCFNQSECQKYCSGQTKKLVCGNDSVVYDNECFAKCNGKEAVDNNLCKKTFEPTSGVSIEIGSGALPAGVTVNEISSQAKLISLGAEREGQMKELGRKIIGQPHDITVSLGGEEINKFAAPITLEFTYTAEEISGFNEDSLTIYLYNEDDQQWEALPTTIDKEKKTVTAKTTHLTNAVMAATPQTPAASCLDYCQNTVANSMPAGLACLCSRNNPKCPVSDPTCTRHESGIIDRATNWIFYLALVLCPLFILLGAFMFYAAAGDPKNATTGKKIVIWAAIGLAIALFTKLIYAVIRFLIGQ